MRGIRFAMSTLFVLAAAASCGTASSGISSRGPAVARSAGAEHRLQTAAACPRGFIWDGGRCRRRRGIIIDQSKPAPTPEPPLPVPPPVPAPVPAPSAPPPMPE